jgi:hypothetical protein
LSAVWCSLWVKPAAGEGVMTFVIADFGPTPLTGIFALSYGPGDLLTRRLTDGCDD